MLIKRFEAASTREALAEVRKAFGPDAVILSSRNLSRRRGAFGLLSKSVAEVTAAIDRDPRVGDGSADPTTRPGDTAAARDVNATTRRTGADPSWRSLQISRAVVAPLEEEIRSLREAVALLGGAQAAPPSLGQEVAELRRVARALAARLPEPRADDPEAAYRAAGIAPEWSREIGAEAQLRLARGEARSSALRDALAARLEPKLCPWRDDRGHQLLVGAPGVGKTISLAKQAARQAEGQARWVSTDVHRHGGRASLTGVAAELGARVESVSDPEGLGRLARQGSGRLWVDTPGGGGDDPARLAELCLQRAALGDRVEVQLVVSATTKECDLRRQIALHRCLEPSSLVVTGIDASLELGSVVNVLLDEATPPLGWLGTGQRVPDDLDLPDPQAFAERVLAVCP